MDYTGQSYLSNGGIGIMSGIKDILALRLSIKEIYLESLIEAKGLSYSHMFFTKKDRCLFCGKEEDYLFGFVTLTSVYFGEILGIRYICNEHKGEWWDCATGQKVINPGKSKLLSLFHQLILWIVIFIRTMWYFLRTSFMWYVAIWPYYWYRQLTK